MILKKFAFGIRFTKGFHVEDQLGAIVDEILYSEGSAFNEKFFSEVQRGDGIRRLVNRLNTNSLTISVKDVIFEYTVEQNFESELGTYLTEFNKTIINKIFSIFKIKNVARFGFIIYSELENEDGLLKNVSESIKNTYDIESAESLSLRFNIIKKTPLKIGKEVTEDFDNTIITYDRQKKDQRITFAVDYQKYFNPALDQISDAPTNFVHFCESCYNNYGNTYGKK